MPINWHEHFGAIRFGAERLTVSHRRARQHNDQAHPPPKAGATGGTTKAQAVGGRVQRLVSSLLGACKCRACSRRNAAPHAPLQSRARAVTENKRQSSARKHRNKMPEADATTNTRAALATDKAKPNKRGADSARAGRRLKKANKRAAHRERKHKSRANFAQT